MRFPFLCRTGAALCFGCATLLASGSVAGQSTTGNIDPVESSAQHPPLSTDHAQPPTPGERTLQHEVARPHSEKDASSPESRSPEGVTRTRRARADDAADESAEPPDSPRRQDDPAAEDAPKPNEGAKKAEPPREDPASTRTRNPPPRD